ncbi:23180_t:CDS:2 [Entrophospora sp. SA101]|nr:23180_t:CDS:2 [Entrophospora sp. SA101]
MENKELLLHLTKKLESGELKILVGERQDHINIHLNDNERGNDVKFVIQKLGDNQLRTVNGQKLKKLKTNYIVHEISQYYKTKAGRSTVDDKAIRELVKQLNGEEELIRDNKYYSFEPLYIGYRAYKLV